MCVHRVRILSLRCNAHLLLLCDCSTASSSLTAVTTASIDTYCHCYDCNTHYIAPVYMLNTQQLGRKDIAIARVEQIAPFPFDRVAEESKKYTDADVYWVQEEPKNMGAYRYIPDKYTLSLQYTLYSVLCMHAVAQCNSIGCSICLQ
jgi:2-oxoglutarate dehydrogenase C-terminal